MSESLVKTIGFIIFYKSWQSPVDSLLLKSISTQKYKNHKNQINHTDGKQSLWFIAKKI
jgi:hypothetical protein